MEALCAELLIVEKRDPSIPPVLVFHSCGKGSPYPFHPHRGTDVLIKLIKTVRRTGKVVLLVDKIREVLHFIGILEMLVALMRCGAYLLIGAHGCTGCVALLLVDDSF